MRMTQIMVNMDQVGLIYSNNDNADINYVNIGNKLSELSDITATISMS